VIAQVEEKHNDTKTVALGNRTSLYFIGTKRAAAQSQREQCRKKTAIIQKEDKTPMYKMQKIMPPISVTVSAAKAKRGSHHPPHVRQTATTKLERERKQKPGPKGIIWSITDSPAPPKPPIPSLREIRCFVQFFLLLLLLLMKNGWQSK
jgi:hypothetical protein